MMKLLTRDAILNAQDLPTEDVEMLEWGGTVRVRTLTGTERDYFEQSVLEQKGKNSTVNMKNLRAKLVALTIVDEEGNRIFSQQDVNLLGKKSALALNRVFEVAQRLNGLKPEDVEELTKNSESDQSDDFISD